MRGFLDFTFVAVDFGMAALNFRQDHYFWGGLFIGFGLLYLVKVARYEFSK